MILKGIPFPEAILEICGSVVGGAAVHKGVLQKEELANTPHSFQMFFAPWLLLELANMRL